MNVLREPWRTSPGGRHPDSVGFDVNNAQTWTAIGGLLALVSFAFGVLYRVMRDGFATLDAKFEARFDAVDAKFDTVDARFDAVERRLDAHDARFDTLEARLEAKIDAVHESLRGRIDRLDVQHAAMQTSIDNINRTLNPIAEELLRAGIVGRRATG